MGTNSIGIDGPIVYSLNTPMEIKEVVAKGP